MQQTAVDKAAADIARASSAEVRETGKADKEYAKALVEQGAVLVPGGSSAIAYVKGEKVNPVALGVDIGTGFIPAFRLGRLVGRETHIVYQGIDEVTGAVKYIGITKRNPVIRFAEHAASNTERATLQYFAIDGASNLTRIQARVIEQKLINKYGLNNLVNVRNSISPYFWRLYGIKP